jgi:hypothetical protein
VRRSLRRARFHNDVCGRGLIADQAGAAIDDRRVQATRTHIALCTRDEDAACLIERIQTREVQIAQIHDVEGTRLGQQQIEHVDVVQFSAEM